MNNQLTTPPIPTNPAILDPMAASLCRRRLMPALDELEEIYLKAKHDKRIPAGIDYLRRTFVGRPTALTYASRLNRILWRSQNLFKARRFGPHRPPTRSTMPWVRRFLDTNARMKKTRIVAETGAGQHGVATATVAAKLASNVSSTWGTVDMARQLPNVYRMQLLAPKCAASRAAARRSKMRSTKRSVTGSPNVAPQPIIYWAARWGHTPIPTIVRDFQSVIGHESIEQMLNREIGPGRLPDAVVACVGGGSNAIGIFHPFLNY